MDSRGSCEHAAECPLFGQFRMKSILQFWIRLYCQGNWSTCARYVRSQRGEPIPLNLLPSGELLKEGPRQ